MSMMSYLCVLIILSSNQVGWYVHLRTRHAHRDQGPVVALQDLRWGKTVDMAPAKGAREHFALRVIVFGDKEFFQMVSDGVFVKCRPGLLFSRNDMIRNNDSLIG